jgi:hypothetical protein
VCGREVPPSHQLYYVNVYLPVRMLLFYIFYIKNDFFLHFFIYLCLMKLLCIKRIEPYWGIAFKEGNLYSNFSERNIPTTLIIDDDNYWKYLRLVAKSKDYAKEYKQEEMWKVIPGYLTLTQIDEQFCKKINASYYDIKGDDNQISSFCTMTKKELLENHGSTKFQLSIRLLEDYFQTIEDIRENKLNILEI